MAPVQNQSSYSIKESSFSVNPSNCFCGSSLLNDWEWWLPVSRRGHFFQDSFFEDARVHFDAAVKNVLSKWDDREIFNDLWQQETSSSRFDNLNRYRLLHTSNEPEENQVTTLISDNNSHKIVMDVHDLMAGDIKVKVVGEKEVVVEGQSFGSLSSTMFSRRFCFPSTANMASVTSVLSADGVLTIEAPRLSTTANLGEISDSVIRKISTDDTNLRASTVVDDRENAKVFYCKGCNKRIGSWDTISEPSVIHQEGMKVPIRINATETKSFARSSEKPASEVISNETTSKSLIEDDDENVKHKMKNDETHFKDDENYFSTEKKTNDILTVSSPKRAESASLREFIIPISIEKVEDGVKGVINNINTTHTTREDLKERNQTNSCGAHQDSFVSLEKQQSLNFSTSKESNMTSSQRNPQSSVNTHNVISKPSTELIIPIHVEGSCNRSNSYVKNRREVADGCDNIISKRLQETQKNNKEETEKSSFILNRNNCTFKHVEKYQVGAAETKKFVPITTSSAYPPNSRYLLIERRGSFFVDSFFEGYRKDFEAAVSEVLLKSREYVQDGELINNYRSLRQRNLKVENQALRVHEDQRSFRVVLDVKDFTDGDITVSVDGEELFIEGRTEKAENKSSDSLTFSHRFLLPETTNFTSITSAISSDGILTINSPKAGNVGEDAVRKVVSEAESEHESHNGGSHFYEKKNRKESSQLSQGFSSHTLCSSFQSKQHHSSLL